MVSDPIPTSMVVPSVFDKSFYALHARTCALYIYFAMRAPSTGYLNVSVTSIYTICCWAARLIEKNKNKIHVNLNENRKHPQHQICVASEIERNEALTHNRGRC